MTPQPLQPPPTSPQGHTTVIAASASPRLPAFLPPSSLRRFVASSLPRPLRASVPPCLRAFHHNQRGNIGILFLLTILALTSLIWMLWNTTKVASRREQLQTAADTASHSAATWVSRCTNAIAAQNMVIGQDASEEAIWRAIPPTDQAVRARLEQELAAVAPMQKDDPLPVMRDQMLDALQHLDAEYALAESAWQQINALAQQDFADQQAGDQFRTKVRQAGEVLHWVQNTYVNGQPTAVADRPGPPYGVGLRQLVTTWCPPHQNTGPLYQAITDSLFHQLAVLAQFETRTAPATAQDVPARVAAHRAEVFDAQRLMAAGLPHTIQQQLTQHADFTQTRLTLATTGRGAQPTGPALVEAPIVPADNPTTVSHFDMIRQQMINIDPINVHTDNTPADAPPATSEPTDPDDARIWHPDITVNTQQALQCFPPFTTIPASVLARLPDRFTVNCNIPGGWGHNYGNPLRRYVGERIYKDEQGLRVYMRQIDFLRYKLFESLRDLLHLPLAPNVYGLPVTLQDSVTDGSGNFAQIAVPLRLTPPADASDDLRAQTMLYNQHAAAYTGHVRRLATLLNRWAHYFDRFTDSFAVGTWESQVGLAGDRVLKQLGLSKQFMVLATYQLRHIPDWAQPGMTLSAQSEIESRINMDSASTAPIYRAVLETITSGPNNTFGDFLDPAAIRTIQAGWSSAIASSIVRYGASIAAQDIAAEWVARPWAYEITPPDQAPTPDFLLGLSQSHGFNQSDRQTYVTLLAAARPTAANTPRILLPKLFGSGPAPLAFAQAESFNPMEFQYSYGSDERFSAVTWDMGNNEVHYGPLGFFGAPRPWRLSTIGGWNWHPRLAGADALPPALAHNPEFADFFTEGGITNHDDAQSLQTLSLH